METTLSNLTPPPTKGHTTKNNKDNMQVEKQIKIAGKNIHNDPCVSLVEISSYKQFLRFHYNI